MIDPSTLLAGLGVLAALLIIYSEPRKLGWPRAKASPPDAVRFLDDPAR
jgi:hypothetical protein